MLISVIIPTYNRAITLKRAIDSVLMQNHPSIELIVINDGSTDETSTIIEGYQGQLQTITQSNQGVSAARNAGILKARGQWIALLDSDDTWHPNKINEQMKFLENNPHCKILQSQEKWIRNGQFVNAKHKHTKPSGWIFEECLQMCAVSPSAVIIHKDIFDHVGLFDETLTACEDYDLWLRIALHYPIELIDHVLITKYGGHADQLSRSIWGLDRFRIIALEKLLKDPHLNETQRSQVIEILTQKIQIMIKGLTKREKIADAQIYQQKLSSFL